VDGSGAAVDRIVEMAVPLAALGLLPGDRVTFQVELRHGRSLVERLPGAESVRSVVPDRDFEAFRWQV
jgi:hypothetical protein